MPYIIQISPNLLTVSSFDSGPVRLQRLAKAALNLTNWCKMGFVPVLSADLCISSSAPVVLNLFTRGTRPGIVMTLTRNKGNSHREG